MLKSLLIPIVVLSLLANVAILSGIPTQFIRVSNININELDTIKADLNDIFKEIILETDGDVVWVRIFHSISGRAVRDTEIYALSELKFEPLYESTLHFLLKDPDKSYTPKQNDPILNIARMADTLEGNCVSHISPSPIDYTVGKTHKTLIIRCPLIFEDKVVGSYGITITDADLIRLNQTVEDDSDFLLSKSREISIILFK